MIACLFPGQGSQNVGMCNDFSKSKEIFQKMDDIFGLSISKLIDESPILTRTDYLQTIIMCTSLAAFIDFNDKNSQEKIMAGHSLGEYTALTASGAISIEDSIKLLKIRGKAMHECDSGGMVAVLGSNIETVENILIKITNGQCVIANDNSQTQLIISGDNVAIEEATAELKKQNIKCMKLNTSGAFHSPLMEKAALQLNIAINETHIKTPKNKIIFNYSGDITDDVLEIKSLMLKQLTGKVKWRETIEKMINNGVTEFYEFGGKPVLINMITKDYSNIKTKHIKNIVDLL